MQDLGAGVDQVVRDLRVFGPRGNQPPLQFGELAWPRYRDYHLRRSNVIARRDFSSHVSDAVILGHLRQVFSLCVSSVHSDILALMFAVADNESDPAGYMKKKEFTCYTLNGHRLSFFKSLEIQC
jgi:hypothetical protein